MVACMTTEGKLEDHLFKKIPKKTMKIIKGFCSFRQPLEGQYFSPAVYNGLAPPVRGQRFPLLFADLAAMMGVK
jgi:hypothetical protein